MLRSFILLFTICAFILLINGLMESGTSHGLWIKASQELATTPTKDDAINALRTMQVKLSSSYRGLSIFAIGMLLGAILLFLIKPTQKEEKAE